MWFSQSVSCQSVFYQSVSLPSASPFVVDRVGSKGVGEHDNCGADRRCLKSVAVGRKCLFDAVISADFDF